MSKEAVRKRHQRRRAILNRLKRMSGCAICGCRDASLLHFDHIRPEEKLFAIGGHASCGRAKLKAELQKCQVLCRKHHDVKTAAERAVLAGRHPFRPEPGSCHPMEGGTAATLTGLQDGRAALGPPRKDVETEKTETTGVSE